MHNIDHGEMLAIAEALDVAICLATSGKFNGTVRIFSDSKECLRLLDCADFEGIWRRRGYIDRDMKEIICAVIWMSHHLRSLLPPEAAPLELNWIPGHRHSIYPHLVVDELSRDVRCGTTVADRLNKGKNPEFRWEWEKLDFQQSRTSEIDLQCAETSPYWWKAPSRR